MGTPGKILVIKPSSLGDVVHVFPALEVLRRSFPDSELDFVIHPAFAGLLDLSPFPVRRKILFDRKKLGSPKSFFPEFVKLLKELRKENYELVVDFQGLFRSGVLAWCARSCITAGFASPREKSAALFYNRKFDVLMEQHAVSRYVELANRICGTGYAVPECPVNVAKPPFPEVTSPYVVLVPGARWESKVFPPELFGETFNAIKAQLPQCKAVVAGAASDAPAAARIKAIAGEACIDLTGKTSLLELARLMSSAAAVLTNDSGPMHVAAMTGVRIFALFGPTSPFLTGPWGKDHKIVTVPGLPCTGCMKRECPAAEKHLCHKIDPIELGGEIASYIKNQSTCEVQK